MSTGLATYDGQDITRVAAADLSSYQYCPVYEDTSGTVNVVGSAGATVKGILQNAPESGEVARIRTGGHSLCKVDGVIAANVKLMAEGSSSYRATTATGAGEDFFAVTMTKSTAAGDFIDVVIDRGVMHA
jgi:hypothetical protein